MASIQSVDVVGFWYLDDGGDSGDGGDGSDGGDGGNGGTMIMLAIMTFMTPMKIIKNIRILYGCWLGCVDISKSQILDLAL